MPAAGMGRRLGCAGPKALTDVGGMPLLVRSLACFEPQGLLEGAIIPIPEDHAAAFGACLDLAFPGVAFQLVPGGGDRQQSVWKGLQALAEDTEYVVIHDAARPFVPPRAISEALYAAKEFGAATVAVQVSDTILESGPDGFLRQTPDRANLWACQTPQTFRTEVIQQAHQNAAAQGFRGTDDATLANLAGYRVCLVPGAASNLKVTTPADLAMAEALVSTETTTMRIGTGYDLHRLEPGRALVLGGVTIPHTAGLAGHSDADVLAHALTDALLGAAALGNIGELFPDTDPAYAGADSMELLDKAYRLVCEAGFSLSNADSTVVAQRPKLNAHIPTMRERIAACLGVPLPCISIKAKTNEGKGPEGREEAISAQAAVLLSKSA